jgi:site-specific DNA-methyltransferase (adenine-specific)
MHGSLTGGTKGRFPANVIHDGSEEVEAEFAKAGVRTSGARNGIRKANSSFGGAFVEKERDTGKYTNSSVGSASRFFQSCPPDTEPARFIYNPKASKKDRGKGNTHPTTKPIALMRYLARLTKTPYGGIILDPFAGSGTTGLAAKLESRQAILIEKEPEYCEIIVNRLENKKDVSPVKEKPSDKVEVWQPKLFEQYD